MNGHLALIFPILKQELEYGIALRLSIDDSIEVFPD